MIAFDLPLAAPPSLPPMPPIDRKPFAQPPTGPSKPIAAPKAPLTRDARTAKRLALIGKRYARKRLKMALTAFRDELKHWRESQPDYDEGFAMRVEHAMRIRAARRNYAA